MVAPEVELQETLPNLKRWYAQKTKNNDKSTTEAIFMPQWGEGLLHTLDDGTRLAVFPVWRELAVRYYDVGFVRRLAIRLDAANQVIDGSIIEIMGDMDYLRENLQTIQIKYFEKKLAELSGEVGVFEKAISPEELANQKNTAGCIGYSYVFNSSSCTFTFTSCYGSSWIQQGNCIGGNTSATKTVYDVPTSKDTGGGGAPSSGYDPSSIPPAPIDKGENLNPTLPVKVEADTSITNNPRLKCIYDKVSTNSVFKDLAKVPELNGIKVVIKKGTITSGANGNCDPNEIATKKLITITLNKDRVGEERWAIEIARTIIHEMLHAKFLTELHKIGGYQKLTEANNKELYDAYKNHPGTTIDPHSLPQHNLMSTDKYLDIIANAIKEYDTRNANNPEATFDLYKAMAWGGLTKHSVRYQNMSSEEKLNIDLNLDFLRSITLRSCE